MTAPLSAQKIAEVAAAKERVTPGPWRVHCPSKYTSIVSEEGLYVMEAKTYGVIMHADAEFIALAPDAADQLAACWGVLQAVRQHVLSLETVTSAGSLQRFYVEQIYALIPQPERKV